MKQTKAARESTRVPAKETARDLGPDPQVKNVLEERDVRWIWLMDDDDDEAMGRCTAQDEEEITVKRREDGKL